MRRFMRIVVTFSGCLLLLVPIILLYLLHSDVAKLVIIVTTVLLFTTVTSAITAAKSWEVVAASIAYAWLYPRRTCVTVLTPLAGMRQCLLFSSPAGLANRQGRPSRRTPTIDRLKPHINSRH